MPAELISTIHQLAVTCKKYKGIVFAKMNKIKDTNDPETDTCKHKIVKIIAMDKMHIECGMMTPTATIAIQEMSIPTITGA